VLLSALALVALGVGATPFVAAGQPLFRGGHDPVAGARLFTEKGCSSCHTVDGKSAGRGPDLRRTARARSFYDLGAALWNHAPQMAAAGRRAGAARPTLTEREIGHITAYLFTLDYFDPPGDAEHGRRLFTEKRCIACHEVAGSGGHEGPKLDKLKPYASPVALAAAMWNHGPAMAKAMAARGVERPVFTGRELIDLIAFVNQASPTLPSGPVYVIPGRVLDGAKAFADQRCVECHRPSTGGDKKVDLAEREAHKSLTDFAAAMWNKGPLMVAAMEKRSLAVPRMSPQTMADIVAYLYAVRYFAEAGDPRQGVILAQQRGCFDCHGLYGERGKPASDLSAAKGIGSEAGALAALWNHAFLAQQVVSRERAAAPTFTGPEMANLIAYLRSLARPR
jgi:mono/diheme cytochrome c family protein